MSVGFVEIEVLEGNGGRETVGDGEGGKTGRFARLVADEFIVLAVIGQQEEVIGGRVKVQGVDVVVEGDIPLGFAR